jgi:hypothetical protein
MKSDIGIAVSEKPFFIRNIDSAEYQSAVFDEAMDIVSQSGSYHIS